jgi:hypothetical protein
MVFLIDSDLILEGILNRSNIQKDALETLYQLTLSGYAIYITEPGFDKVLSITRLMAASEEAADTAVNLLESLVKIIYVEANDLHKARRSVISDFESALEVVCAEKNDIHVLITHQPDNFCGIDQYAIELWTLDELRKRPFITYTKDNLDSAEQIVADDIDAVQRINLESCYRSSHTISNLSKIQHFDFVCRKSEVASLLSYLGSSFDNQIINIWGEPGSGKTRLAHYVAWLYTRVEKTGYSDITLPYDAVVFVPSLHSGGFLNSPVLRGSSNSTDYLGYLARVIASTFNDDSINRALWSNQCEKIYSCFERQRTLLILDGLDDQNCNRQKLQEFLNGLPKRTKVIITSRCGDFGDEKIELKPLSKLETKDLVHRTIEVDRLILREDEIEQINRYCMGNPLAVKMVVLQYSNFPGSLCWERNLCKNTDELFNFLGAKLLISIPSRYAQLLLRAMAFAKNSFDVEVLTHLIGDEKDEHRKLRSSLAELCRLSLVIEEGKRYSLNPIIRDFVLRWEYQSPSTTKWIHQRLVTRYLYLSEKYGGTDWGDWYADYDFIESEWDNFQSVLQLCLTNGAYVSFKRLWNNLNHFADLYGYWSDRIVWLNHMIELSQQNNDITSYVSSLSRKAWTLMMIAQVSCLVEAERLLDKAWELRHHAAWDTQNYLAHHRTIFYTRTGRYLDAEQALGEQHQILENTDQHLIEARQWDRFKLNFLKDQAKLDLRQHKIALAQRRFEVALQKAKEINWQRGICYAHNQLANIALVQEDFQRAETHLREGIAIARRNRNKRRIAGLEKSFAKLEQQRGNEQIAKRWATCALNRYLDIGMEKESQAIADEFELYLHLKI